MKEYSGQRYTFNDTCYKCGQYHGRTQDMCLDSQDFRFYCSGCRQGKSVVQLESKEIYDGIVNVLGNNAFAQELRSRTLTKTYSFRPSIDQIYYMLQVAQEERLYSWNEVMRHIVNQAMKNKPINEPLRANPIPTRQRNTFNDLVSNPFKREDSIESVTDSKPVEPKPELQPEPVPEKVEEPEEEIFTL